MGIPASSSPLPSLFFSLVRLCSTSFGGHGEQETGKPTMTAGGRMLRRSAGRRYWHMQIATTMTRPGRYVAG